MKGRRNVQLFTKTKQKLLCILLLIVILVILRSIFVFGSNEEKKLKKTKEMERKNTFLPLIKIHDESDDVCVKEGHYKNNICALYMIKNDNYDKFDVKSSRRCDNDFVNDKFSYKTEEISQDLEINLITNKDELIECIKYYFYLRNSYLFQDFNENLALKLHLELISRQLCLTTWNNINLDYFNDLSLSRTYKPIEKKNLKLFNPDNFINLVEKSSFCYKIPSIFIPTDKYYGTGFGGRLTWFTQVLSLSFTVRTPKSRIMLTQKGDWPFSFGGNCKTEDHRCFFKLFSNCYISKETLKNENNYEEWSLETNKTLVTSKIEFSFYPEKYKKKGIFWFYSQVLYFLLQPNNELIKHMKNIKYKYHNLIDPYMVTMHIRRGDKFLESSLFKLNSYLIGVRKLENSLNIKIKNILYLTDDYKVIEEIKNIENLTNYNFFTINKPQKQIEKSRENSFHRIKNGKLNGYNNSINMLEGIYLSLEGKYFVGTLNSNLGRVFFKLMSAKQNRIIDHISLSVWKLDVTNWGGYGCKILNF